MKPIPENRRWQEERQRNPDRAIPMSPQQSEVIIVLAEPPVIPARYAGVCPACGRTIQLGAPITRHIHLNRWVHQECRNAPIGQAGIPARYPGFCRACRRAIQVGEPIVRHALRGWVHLHCAQTLATVPIDQSLVDAIVEQLMDDDRLDDWEDDDVG